MEIPKHYLPVMPYLILSDANGFLEFVKTVFGATEQLIVPGDSDRTIVHGEIRIGDAVIMFTQANSDWTNKPAGMFIYIEDVKSTHETALKNGAKALTEPALQEYGYSSGFEDPFGNQWWITQVVTE